MIRRILKFVLLGLAMVSCVHAQVKEIQIIRDPDFQWGFEINATPTGKKVVERDVKTTAVEPVWAIAQWRSRYSLADAKLEQSGQCQSLADTAKWVRFACAEEGMVRLALGMDTRKEYLGGYRKKGEPWPHLLVEQPFEHQPRLDTLKSLRFTLDAHLTQAERFEEAGYNPALHAAQCLAYFVLQNRNRESEGFGDFLWLGVQIYDDRLKNEAKIIEGDVGHNKLIFHPARNHYTDADYTPGDWWHFESDMLPLAIEALHAAWERSFLEDSQNICDYAIIGMNLGWEVPGIHKVEVEIKGLGLYAVVE